MITNKSTTCFLLGPLFLFICSIDFDGWRRLLALVWNCIVWLYGGYPVWA